MKRAMLRCGALAFLGLATVSLSELSAADKDEKKAAKYLSIEEIMEKAHKKGGALPAIDTLLKAKEVKWDAVSSSAKDLLLLAGDLAKNKPDKGEQASWDKMTKTYLENVQKLEKAATDKNVEDARDARRALANSCMSCHKAHKP